MGFLNYVLASLGAETKDKANAKSTKEKTKKSAHKATFLKQRKPENAGKQNRNVAIFYPKNLTDLNEIVQFLATGNQALLNFKNVDKKVFQRVLDFVAGAIWALGGKVENLGNGLFLYAPKNTSILNKGSLYED